MTRLDETFRPDPTFNQDTSTEPRELRIYESSVPGAVSITVIPAQPREGWLPVGMRLSPAQQIRLYAVLGQHLGIGDLLLRYSEWLDSEGLIVGPKGNDQRSHEDLSNEFLFEVLAA